MAPVPVSLSGAKETLLATVYGRAVDATSPHPILGDAMSADLVDRLDYDFGRAGVSPVVAASIAARAKFFDHWTRDFVERHPGSTVLHLAAGLDTRLWRVDPGPDVRWYDVDFPEVIELRRQLLPERAGCRLLGAAITADGSWLPDIDPDPPVLVVAEGLTMYLEPDEGHTLFRRITDHFRGGELVFDTHSSLAVRWGRFNPAVRAAGATLRWGVDDPREIERANARLRLLEAQDALSAPGVEELPRPTRLVATLTRPLPGLRHLGMYLRFGF